MSLPSPKATSPSSSKTLRAKINSRVSKPSAPQEKASSSGRLPAQRIDFAAERRKNIQKALAARVQPRKHFISADLAVDKYLPALQRGNIEIGRRIEKDKIAVAAQVRVRGGRYDQIVGEVFRRGIKQVAAERLQIFIKAQRAPVRSDQAQPVSAFRPPFFNQPFRLLGGQLRRAHAHGAAYARATELEKMLPITFLPVLPS